MQLPQFQVHAALEDRHWWFLGRRAIVRAILERLLPSREALIVDAGCGTGGNTAMFAQTWRCIGIDPIQEAIVAARGRYPGVDFRVGTAPDDVRQDIVAADAVLLLDVLEHVEDDFALVSHILSTMKPGAYLLLLVPADLALWGPHDRGFEHYRRYDASRLRLLWQRLPTTELLLSPCNSRLYWPVRFARAFTRLMGRSLGASDTDVSLPPRTLNTVLRNLFASETSRLLRVLEGRARPFTHGVSLLAVLRREAGGIVPRSRPLNLPRDPRPWLP